MKGDPARDLATVHHVCENHLPELVDISKEMNSIKVIILQLSCATVHRFIIFCQVRGEIVHNTGAGVLTSRPRSSVLLLQTILSLFHFM